MTIPSFKILKKNAAERLAAAENSRGILLVYTGIITAMAVLVTAVNYALGLRIDQTGGLSSIGLRSVLSTIQSVLPMLQSFIAMCLELGLLAAMLRIAREQYASEKTLKLGFSRFWTLLRFSLIQSGIYMLISLAAVWVASQVYVFTPLSKPLMDLLTPIVTAPGFTMEALTADAALLDQLLAVMQPLILLCAAVSVILIAPVSYSMRMSKYVIIDQPARGAIYAISESRKMMRGSRMRLFRLDVSLWWWYALSAGSTALCYGDLLLPMAGVTLPWPAEVSYFVFYGLFLAVQFAACVCLRGKVEVVYAQAYNALKPREKDTGVVLGNIFQM